MSALSAPLQLVLQLQLQLLRSVSDGDGDDAGAVVRGWVGVAVAVVLFGSFSLFMRLPRVRAANLHPVLYQLYMGVAMAVVAPIVFAWSPPGFTEYGLYGAMIWVPTNLLAIVAVRWAGVAVAQGTWSGITIVMSFIWGTAYFHDPLRDLGEAIGAIVLLVLAVVGIASSSMNLWARCFACARPRPAAAADSGAAAPSASTSYSSVSGDEPAAAATADAERQPLVKSAHVQDGEAGGATAADAGAPLSPLRGVLVAVVVAVMNGTMMLPLRLAPPGTSEMTYACSFGVGALIVSVFIALVYYAIVRRALPELHLRACLVPALLSGLFIYGGNIGSVYASLPPLGLARGFPLTQAALVVSGLWGVLLFKEIRGVVPVLQFFASAVLLVGAALMLGASG